MESKKDVFVFESYSVLKEKKEIHFKYKFNDIEFTEKITLPEQIPSSVNPVLLTKVVENLHLMLGISYFKMFCPRTISIPYSLTLEQSQFWNTVYTKGLGEFFYINRIDYRGLISFPYSTSANSLPISEIRKERSLVGIGGGKDSIVAIEILKKANKPITGLILETGSSLVQQNVAKTSQIDCLVVKRQLDEKLFQLSKKVFNGHVPFSAIFAFISLMISIIYDYSNVVTANEKSSSFGNVEYLGNEINHQWSKSKEFENLFDRYVKRFITSDVNYFSILRDYSELQITELFVQHKKYFSVFSSCNKNFKIKDKTNKRWCGICPKCAFVFIILAAYVNKKEIIEIFDKNLLDDKNLTPLYIDLLGKGKMKPFECVGTFEESMEAFKKIKQSGEFNKDFIMMAIDKYL